MMKRKKKKRKNKKSCSDFNEYTWIEKYKGRSDINPDDLEKKIKNEISKSIY